MRGCGARLVALAVALLALGLGSRAPARAQAAREVGVRYRSAETVYLDAGSAGGIAVGDRFEIRRGGRVVGEVEVIFTAERSASARVLRESEPIGPGDRARRIGGAAEDPAPEDAAAAPPATPPASAETQPRPRTERAPAPPTASRSRATRASGTLSLEWRGTGSSGEDPSRDSSRSLARLHFRARDLAGTPLQLRLRGRVLDLSRDGQRSTLPPDESRDRLYEAALIYDEPGALFGARLGRLGGGPLLSLGYLDGALVEVRPLAGLAAGAVYGRRADRAELGGGDGGTRAGAFVRLGRSRSESEGRSFEVSLAGFREESEDGSFVRDTVALESHANGGERWSFHQHLELDLDVPGSDGEEGQQLSVASATLVRRLERGGRLSLGYDRFQRPPTEEDATLPEGFLDRFARQGLRLGWSRESAGGLLVTVDAGARFREDAPPIHPVLGPFEDGETTYSLRVGAHHRRLPGGLAAGLDLTGFSSASGEGGLAALRVGKRFAAGHEVDLAVGASLQSAPLEDLAFGWGRATAWIELPADLFLRGELELLTGEDLDGRRVSAGVGYRL